MEKDLVDKIIFKTDNTRNRLMLELMARSGMRIGEVIKLKANDVDDRKLLTASPKSAASQKSFLFRKKVVTV